MSRFPYLRQSGLRSWQLTAAKPAKKTTGTGGLEKEPCAGDLGGVKDFGRNKDYRAYRYGDHLEPGAELKIEHSVSCEDVDISSLITMGAENLEAMRQGKYRR